MSNRAAQAKDSEDRGLCWWATYTCGCDEVAEVQDDLPEKCPGHDRDRTSVDRFHVKIGPTHSCPGRRCSGWRP